ncbi:MAG TPA: F0F1 ATP synthase subunit delta [Candidatus Acidoferrales bacterium]|nr:F0F1 ATP synthase subunit delta [Candidatus Acidoferrales bacterium]
MELSWTTFFLEAINFLVLVWLLKRLFYAPVKRAIAQRRAAVEKTLKDADIKKQQAEELKSKYDGRLREWEEEKNRQKEALRGELNEERDKQMKLIARAVAAERERMEAQEEAKNADRRANDEKRAMSQALEFVSRLLRDLASPELEAKISDLLARQISSSPASDISKVGSGNGRREIEVCSAFTMAGAQRDSLISALKQKLGSEISINFRVDPKLLAGLEVAMGSYVWRANLRDELAYFSGRKNHESFH